MAQRRARSPLRWVGYYLPAPCYTGTSWMGLRAALERMGWGMAVLFVGEQDWAAGDAPPPDSLPARCTRTNGLARGTAIFLDVERVEHVSPALRAYVAAWAAALAHNGRYRPALPPTRATRGRCAMPCARCCRMEGSLRSGSHRRPASPWPARRRTPESRVPRSGGVDST